MENIENEVEKITTDHYAMEILKQQSEKSKAEIRGRNAGIIALTVALIAVTISLSIINYKNDVDWRALFADYDFISQDGGGINNVNGGEQGDLNNGATSENAEGREVEGSSGEENEF